MVYSGLLRPVRSYILWTAVAQSVKLLTRWSEISLRLVVQVTSEIHLVYCPCRHSGLNVKMTTSFHQLQRLRMLGVLIRSPVYLPGVLLKIQGKFFTSPPTLSVLFDHVNNMVKNTSNEVHNCLILSIPILLPLFYSSIFICILFSNTTNEC